jgi:hypothetical protein
MHEVGVVHNAIESVFAYVFVKVVEGIITQSCMKCTNFYAPTDFTTEKERQRERGMRERAIPQKLWRTALFWLADDA